MARYAYKELIERIPERFTVECVDGCSVDYDGCIYYHASAYVEELRDEIRACAAAMQLAMSHMVNLPRSASADTAHALLGVALNRPGVREVLR